MQYFRRCENIVGWNGARAAVQGHFLVMVLPEVSDTLEVLQQTTLVFFFFKGETQ